MGISGGSTTTTQNQTAQTILPSWVNQGSRDIYNFAKQTIGQNGEYKPFTGDRTAGFGSSWEPAKDWLTDTIGQSNPDIDTARSAYSSIMNNINPNKSVADYMNPFVQGVLDPSVRRLNESFDKQRGNLAASATSAGAFGDNSHAIEKALLNRDQGVATGDLASKVYSDAFGQAQGQQNAERAQLAGAAGATAGLGNQQFQQNMTSANAAAGMGATEQGVEQKGIDTQMAEWIKAQGWSGEQATRIAQILAMLPTNKTVNSTGTTTQPDNSGMALLGSLVAPVAASII